MRNEQLMPNPPAIVDFAQINSIEQLILVAQQQKKFNTQEELIHYITHEVNNVRHSSGRINMKMDERKQILFANSVSPYSKTFLDNIEDGVADLVKLLLKKRYLTYSSCEGHGYTFRRYVGLAFSDETTREKVASYIENLKIRGVKVKRISSVVNQNAEFNNATNRIQFKEKFNPLELEGEEKAKHLESETNTFNIQFHRNYDSYCFLEIIILQEVTSENFWKNPFKSLWLIYQKKYNWDKITQKLVKSLEHKDFPKYPY